MQSGNAAPAWAELDSYVEAFERRQARAGDADLADYLPAPDHPLYPAVLRELIRADLEYHWEAGQPKRVEDYLARFPELGRDAAGLGEVAFEEYRLRRQAGEPALPAEYRGRLRIDPSDWPVLPTGSDSAPVPPPASLEQVAAAYLENCARPAQNGSAQGLAEALSSLPQAQAPAAVLLDLHHADPDEAQRLAKALTSLPAEGLDFLGFHLLYELGRGAFSRVFLATQQDLADRPVALKITGLRGGEARSLARLQHTNIVPIHSVHRAHPFQALCMPYFGATTLADVIRALRQLPCLPSGASWLVQVLHQGADPVPPGHPVGCLAAVSYVDAVLELACQLVAGLSHAHERGILHQDLKPANILLSDEGRPMLLDFNLARDSRLQTSAAAAYLGGTLPYMAPEHLAAFRSGQALVDARGDIYALGLILYELLAGRYPFPLPASAEAAELSRLETRRTGPPPALRRWNPNVSPALEAIVRRCLEPQADHRYQTASELREDLERQRAHLPLRHTPEPSLRERARKWGRRHPRLTSSYMVGFVAALFLLGLGGLYLWSQHRLAHSEARHTLRQFQDELRQSRLLLSAPTPDPGERREGIALARRALQRYRVLEDGNRRTAPAAAGLDPEDLDQLGDDLGELLMLLARAEGLEADALPRSPRRADLLRQALDQNQQAETCLREGTNRRAVWLQRALLLYRSGQEREARTWLDKATALPLRTARDYYLAASEKMAQGDFRPARDYLRQARQLAPQDAVIHYALGICHAALGNPARAIACFDTTLALGPAFHGCYYHRGRAHLERHEYQAALADFNQSLEHRPAYLPARIDRVLALAGLKKYKDAIAEATEILATGEAPTRLYFMRAEFRDQAGDRQGARRDRAKGLRRRPADELSWVARGVARLPADPRGALADFKAALQLNPRSSVALQDAAHVLAEYLGRTPKAIAMLDRVLALNPEDAEARAGRGVLHARLGQRASALEDARAVLQGDAPAATRYQVAGIYALTSRTNPGDRAQALRLLAGALRGGHGLDLVAGDRDLDPIRELPQFRRLVAAAQTLQREERNRRGNR
jgi:serine/threonine protein kinase/Tfp pilus assembly protein PilF